MIQGDAWKIVRSRGAAIPNSVRIVARIAPACQVLWQFRTACWSQRQRGKRLVMNANLGLRIARYRAKRVLVCRVCRGNTGIIQWCSRRPIRAEASKRPGW